MIESLISVIIPVYNTAPYLERCLHSVLENTYKNIEVICINDGSTDNSLDVLRQIAATDPRVCVIDKKNGGVSTARNRGLKEAQGEYICFVDSDDWIHREFFCVLLNAGLMNDGDIILGSYENNSNGNADGRKRTLTPAQVTVKTTDEAMNYSYFRNTIWGRLFKRSSLRNADFPDDIQMAEDQIFITKVVSSSYVLRVVQVDTPLYFYYNRPGSLVHSYPKDAYLKVCRWYTNNIDELPRKDYAIFQAFRSVFVYRYEGSFSKNKRIIRRNANEAIKECLKLMWAEKRISLREKIKYLIPAKSASLYRLSLILKDRSMLEWERILKTRSQQS